MKILSGIRSLFGDSQTKRDLFDTEKGHLKNFGGWIDRSRFTKQEMAELDEEVAKGVRQFAVDTMSENTERSKTRRELALFVVKSWVLFLFTSGMTYKIDPEWSALWFSLATHGSFAALILGVSAFFWGTHAYRASKKTQDSKE